MAGRQRPSAMVVAGVMSGTSADGIDVAICRIRPGPTTKAAAGAPTIEVLGHRSFVYAKAVREAVLAAMSGVALPVPEMSQLSWRLGALYADAVEATARELGAAVELVGCHGQTLFHAPGGQHTKPAKYLGEEVRATWQTGESALIAERMRCPVVSDFRAADLAAGGQGAPLVPMLDWAMFRSGDTPRVLANLGGIANVTVLPMGCAVGEVLAFDTGPGNMVIDGCTERLFGKPFDEGGAIAKTGKVYAGEVMRAMREGYFAARPPKSCGREEFGTHFCDSFVEHCRKAGAEDADVIATATALTSSSVVEAYEMFAEERLRGCSRSSGCSESSESEGFKKAVEFIVGGGGTKNEALMGMLAGAFAERGVTVRPTEELGMAAEAKEAVAFALLAWLSWWRMPGNLPGATGTERPVVLGKVSFG